MKVGIVTYHRTLNFGAALQAVALRSILVGFGHEVYFVDYWPSYHKAKYSVFPIQELKGKYLRDKILFVLYELTNRLIPRIRRKRNFDRFYKKYVYPYCVPISHSLDVVVYGSDQIWRKQSTGQYNPFYFGVNEIQAPRHLTYAASAGMLPTSPEEKEYFCKLLSNLQAVSVRELHLANMLNDMGVHDVSHVLDPTLLLTSEKWDEFLSENRCRKKYVLVYSPASSSFFDISEVRKYADVRGLEVIELKGEAFRERDGAVSTCGPEMFISLIKNADCVFSSSFHGVAFSIVYGRQFYASFAMNSSRVSSLLEVLGIDGRIIDPYSVIPCRSDIDYSSVNIELDKLRHSSLAYLQLNL